MTCSTFNIRISRNIVLLSRFPFKPHDGLYAYMYSVLEMKLECGLVSGADDDESNRKRLVR